MGRGPFRIGDFVGQKRPLKPVLRQQDGARAEARPMPALLFTGESGIGKTEAAKALAERANAGDLIKFHCPADVSEIAKRLAEAESLSYVFFDEAHRLPPELQEWLYQLLDANRDNKPVRVSPPKGAASSEEVTIQPLTFFFATNQPGKLLKPLKRRLPQRIHFRPYPMPS
jgi:Holliday junction resolvasome RuvABC ATP-dependent DNA helicase subunit